MWIGSSEGLGILQKRFFENIAALPNGNTTSITTTKDGKVFVNCGNLHLIEPSAFGFTSQLLSISQGGSVGALEATHQHLWVGSGLGYLIELTQSGQSLRSFDLSKRGEGIFYLLHDSQHRLWFCQAPTDHPIVGIGCLLPNGKIQEYNQEKGLSNRILVIKETPKKRIYAGGIGLDSYLYRYLPQEDAFINLSIPFDFFVNPNFEVHDLTVDEKGGIWLATTDGLLKHDMDRIRKVALGGIYTDIEIRSVECMPDGSIWLSSDTEGILRYADGETVAIKEESGLPSKVMGYRCLERDQQNRLWAGSAEGLVYSLDKNPQLEHTPTPLFLAASVDGVQQNKQDLSLIHNQELVLKFVTPAFHGYRTFYQYRVNEEEWSAPSIQKEAHFTDLPLGKQQIFIRSKKEGNNLWSKALVVPVTVSNHWYSNPILQWILLMGLMLSLLYFFWYRKQVYKRQLFRLNKVLERKKEENIQQQADLNKARAIILSEQKGNQMERLQLTLIQNIISNIDANSTWKSILKVLSEELLHPSGVVAFEVATQKGAYLNLEGYSKALKNSTHDRFQLENSLNLATHSWNNNQAVHFNQLKEKEKQLFHTLDQRLSPYQSAIGIPFYWNKQRAFLFLYSNKANYFDEYQLKSLQVVGTYLEKLVFKD